MDSETLIKKADDLTDLVTLPKELTPIKPLIKPAQKVGKKWETLSQMRLMVS